MYLCLKKITAWALLLLMAIPVFFSASLLVKQKILHYQREKKFEKETLETVVVSADNIYWVKPGKEILLHGKLFDVKSFTNEGSKISLLGFFDHKEDNLVKQIVQREKQKQQSGNASGNALKFIFFPVYVTHEDTGCEPSYTQLSEHLYTFSESLPVSPGYSITHPPRV